MADPAPRKIARPPFAPPEDLPVTAVLPDLRAALAAAPQVLLHAPPGAGKTTVAPPALLAEPWLAGKSILMLEPRRLAARAAAARIAALLHDEVGGLAGYRTRLDACVSARTRLELLTEGLLLRRLQRDPTLDGVGLVIFDEFHERHLTGDLALALTLDVQRQVRPELRLLVMSATLAVRALQQLLPQARTVSCTGRNYPVTVSYLPATPEGNCADYTVAAIRRALREQAGDILVFLPGSGDIRRAGDALRDLVTPRLQIVPLYGDLPKKAQDAALRGPAPGWRRVILATPLAETSITVPGVQVVIDSGWQRQPHYDPARDLTRLATVRVSKANAEQRSGRAGRLGPGTCQRLWSAGTQHALLEFPVPEILQTDLTPLALELAAWGVSDPATLLWLDPPPAGAFVRARETLHAIGALDPAGRISKTGRQLAALPVHPRLGVMLMHGAATGRLALAADLAALLAERDILPGRDSGCDIASRVEALHRFRRGQPPRNCDLALAAVVDRIARQLCGALTPLTKKKSAADKPAPPGSDRHDAIGALLACAYPDRIGQRRGAGEDNFLLANGRGARLRDGAALRGSDFIVAAAVDAGQRESIIFLAAGLAETALRAQFGDRIAWRETAAWSDRDGEVLARRAEMLGALVLREGPWEQPDPAAVAAALLAGIRARGLAALPWREETRQWQQRVLCLRAWQPEENWPEVGDAWLLANLEVWLAPQLAGITRFARLAALDLDAALANLLDHKQRRRLAELAPTHIAVPTGSPIRLHYTSGQSPVLAVRLQEMFGCTATPRVAAGKVKVLLHLLSPARRPVQVTDDLAGFWQGSYREVRRELRGRYPKHVWPDNPLAAAPTRRAKPRK